MYIWMYTGSICLILETYPYENTGNNTQSSKFISVLIDGTMLMLPYFNLVYKLKHGDIL